MENNKQGAIVKKEPCAVIKCTEPSRIIVTPLADLFETADSFVLKLDMPGAQKDSIGLTVEPEQLTIRATVDSHTSANTKLLYSEIGLKNYLREFRLGHGIDMDNISAQFGNGVLTITLPKTDEVKARSIKIN
jgi:HSP20 family protein